MPDIFLKPLYGDGPNLPLSMPVVLRGLPGASAFELAQAAGFVGSPADWLASLVGELSATDRDLVRQALDLGTRVEERLTRVDDAVRTSSDAAEATARDRQAVEGAAGAASGAARAAGDAAGAAQHAASATNDSKIAISKIAENVERAASDAGQSAETAAADAGAAKKALADLRAMQVATGLAGSAVQFDGTTLTIPRGNTGAPGTSITGQVLTLAAYNALLPTQRDDPTKLWIVIG